MTATLPSSCTVAVKFMRAEFIAGPVVTVPAAGS